MLFWDVCEPGVTSSRSLPSPQGLRPGASTCRPAAADGLSAPRLGAASRGGPLPRAAGPARPEPLPLGAGQHRALQPGSQGKHGGTKRVFNVIERQEGGAVPPCGPISRVLNLEKEKCLPFRVRRGFYFSLQLRLNQSGTCPLNPFILLWEADSKKEEEKNSVVAVYSRRRRNV